jgi:hypothetical protein
MRLIVQSRLSAVPMSLTNTQLAAAFKEGRPIPIPHFDGKQVELFFEDEAELLRFADAIRSFLALSPTDRAAATRHAWAYFKDFTDDVGFEWVDAGMEALPQNSDDIWNFVTPNTLSATESWDVGNREATRQFFTLDANCGWEAEHGLSMSWRDGKTLVKLSAFDGHATNGHAYDDLSKDALVYYSGREEASTK